MMWIDRLKENIDCYRPIPFWSWNAKLDAKTLEKQIVEMKKAGMGGFFMHARSGLITDYMGKEWFEAVDACVEEAERQGMQAWLYDENGWPSGFAGMKLLEDPKNLVHYITFKENDFFDENALANYILNGTSLIRVNGESDNPKRYYAVYDNINLSTVDILNKEVVKKFIKLTHEKYYDKYKGDFGSRLLGFFTDEPQYFRYDTPYSPVLAGLYEELYGESIFDNLAALFIDCENCYRFRWRYWKLLNDQFIKSFAKPVYDWCEEHNCKLTGHAIEECALHTQMWCCAGVMPFYEYEHIPGCDWLGRQIDTEITPKQVSSVAQQLGKKRVLTESFACTGWDVTPRELKHILDWQFVNGVNMLCTHLTPYSLEGSRKYDHPAFFCNANPWFEKFGVMADYVAKLGCMLSESEEAVQVGVIHPIHSAYLTYNRKTDYESVEKLNNDFREISEKLGAANIPHHYIDETLLSKHGKVEGDALCVGLCKYKYIVIPSMKQLDSSTVEFLKAYINNGGKIYLCGEIPSYKSGEKADLSFLKSNTLFNEMKPQFYFTDDNDTAVRSTFRKSEKGDFLYIVNLDMENEQKIKYSISCAGIAQMDILNGSIIPVRYNKYDDFVEIEVLLKPGESKILLMGEYESSSTPKHKVSVDFSKPIMIDSTYNSLVIDSTELSFDGKNYSKSMPIACASDYLLSRCENREVFLNYRFYIKAIPKVLIAEIENMNIISVILNGNEIKLENSGILDEHFLTKDISGLVKLGENNITVKIDYHQSEHIYNVLYRMENVTEALINCLTYDTEIEAVRLYGDFSVELKNYDRDEDGNYIASLPFEISKPKRADMSDIVGSGFPFFAGKMTFTSKATVTEIEDIEFDIRGNFHAAHIKWNEYETEVILDNKVTIPKKWVQFDNNITITVYNGNRNLLGPFHFAGSNELKTVFPAAFTMQGTWKEDHTSDNYRDTFSFVPFGIELE